mmetsp:Transcript_4686/g.5607  ORF Transcript_4686/g.5607 Transcript_4686/m.5607 type:complete len:510 (-) Transcript_4686:408-1937(-)
MSTKMSTDMNVTRPTTRGLAPPGGTSSISFGARGGQPAASDYAAPSRSTPTATPVKARNGTGNGLSGVQVGLAIEGMSVDQSEIAQSIAASGASVTAITVSSSLQISAAIMQLTKVGACDAVVAVYTTSRSGFHSNVVAMSAALGVPCLFGEEGAVQPSAVVDDVAALMSLSGSNRVVGKSGANTNQGSNKAMSLKSVVGAVDSAGPGSKAPVEPVPVDDTIQHLLDVLRISVKKHGASGISGIARKFRIVDDNGNGMLELDEFTKAIREHEIHWSPEEIKLVFDAFDTEGDGSVSYDEFLVTIRGPMNKRREQMVLLAFDVMDKDKSGIIDEEDIASVYNAKKHPDVIEGKKTEKEILDQFLEGFEGNPNSEHDGKVTPAEWIEHYQNISACIDDDDYFELMIRNAWHISGGEGWCANSSNMRVLVTHNDGTQTVEEVRNDIGIKSDDKAQITARLRSQGVDLKGFETSGVVDSTEPAKSNRRPPSRPPSTPPRTPRGQVQKSSVVLG